MFAVKKRRLHLFFSLCYNKLWQHSGEIPSLPSAVNVANVQTDGRKTVFEGKIFLFISTARIQFYLLRDLPPAVAVGLAIKVKWRWKKQVKQIGLKKRIYRVQQCLIWQLVFALWSLFLTVWPETWQASSSLEFILLPLMVLIMSFLTQRSTYGHPALGAVVIPLPSSPPCSTDDSPWRNHTFANEQSCSKDSCYLAEQN